MLAVIVFIDFRESDCGKSKLVESGMITAAKKPVRTKDQSRLNGCLLSRGDLGDITGQPAGWGIMLVPDRPDLTECAQATFEFARIIAACTDLNKIRFDAFAEKTNVPPIFAAARTGRISDDVIREHPDDAPSLGMRGTGVGASTQKPLLLPCGCHENDRAIERYFGEHPGKFEDEHGSRAIVICAWCRGTRIHGITCPAVIVRDDIDMARSRLGHRSGQDGKHIDQFCFAWNSSPRRHGMPIERRLEPPTRFLEPMEDPLPGGADSDAFRVGVAQ